MRIYPLAPPRGRGALSHRNQAVAIVLSVLLELVAAGAGKEARPATPWPSSGAPIANVSEGTD